MVKKSLVTMVVALVLEACIDDPTSKKAGQVFGGLVEFIEFLQCIEQFQWWDTRVEAAGPDGIDARWCGFAKTNTQFKNAAIGRQLRLSAVC